MNNQCRKPALIILAAVLTQKRNRDATNSRLPLQGEGWDGDGLSALPHAFTPIPTLTLPLKGRESFLSTKETQP